MKTVINRALHVTTSADKSTIVSALITVSLALLVFSVVLPTDLIIAKALCRGALNDDPDAITAVAQFRQTETKCSRTYAKK